MYVDMCVRICSAKVNIPGFVLLWELECARAVSEERPEK